MSVWLGLIALVLIAIAYVAVRSKTLAVPEGHQGLLYRSGKFDRSLPTGLNRWMDWMGTSEAIVVPLLPLAEAPIVGEVISADKFAFRYTVTPVVRITDARACHEAAPRVPTQFQFSQPRFPLLSAGAQSILAEHFASLTIDEIATDASRGMAELCERMVPYLQGAEVERLLVTSIKLPPEVRKMFTEVERARRDGLASLERARAEQAALRALANAARALEGNPGLTQLRLLQAMDTAKGQKTFVFGAGDSIGVPVVNSPKHPAAKKTR